MTAQYRIDEDIDVRQNLSIIARERGKIVDRRDGHNIFLDTGRQWLAELIAYISFAPLTTQRDDRVRYMGLGIGGSSQLTTAHADSPPYSDYGPVGGFTQTDLDPTYTSLERPVRVSGGTGAPAPGDVWIGQVGAPPSYPVPASVTFSRVFSQLEISYTPYLSVPLSEVGLFTAAANINDPWNIGLMVAYDTFDTISKTTSVELEVLWTLKF